MGMNRLTGFSIGMETPSVVIKLPTHPSSQS